jgi:hypothetical protein
VFPHFEIGDLGGALLFDGFADAGTVLTPTAFFIAPCVSC